MSLALVSQSVSHDLRKKRLYIKATPSSPYQGPTTAVPTTEFTQPGGAGTPLLGPTKKFISTSALSGNVTFSTTGGTGAGTQVVNMATYTNLTSATPATATAAAVALALALTSGALGTASGATYTGSISGGVLSIATNVGAEVLSISVSALVETIAGGDTVDLTGLTAALGTSDALVGYPGNIDVYSVISGPAGYPPPLLIKGTTLKNWRLRVFSAIDTELPTGNYPADILAGYYVLEVEGPKSQM